jgi:SAM-dependent methyltransferase
VTGRDWEDEADRLAARAIADGEPTRWFDELWSAGARDEVDVPWDRAEPHPLLARHVDALGDGAGRAAVVVGAGLGADAELLADRGWRTVAFDVAPAAVRLARDRHPGSSVDYQVADLLALPDDLVGAFDLAVEIYTVQALPRSLRAAAIAGVRRLVAPGGELLVVQVVRDAATDPSVGPPWWFDREEITAFAGDGLTLDSLAEVPNPYGPEAHPLWRAVLHRAPESRPA